MTFESIYYDDVMGKILTRPRGWDVQNLKSVPFQWNKAELVRNLRPFNKHLAGAGSSKTEPDIISIKPQVLI